MPDPALAHGLGWIGGQRDALERVSERLRRLSARASVEDAMRVVGDVRAVIEGEVPARVREAERPSPPRVAARPATPAALFGDDEAVARGA